MWDYIICNTHKMLFFSAHTSIVQFKEPTYQIMDIYTVDILKCDSDNKL